MFNTDVADAVYLIRRIDDVAAFDEQIELVGHGDLVLLLGSYFAVSPEDIRAPKSVNAAKLTIRVELCII